MTRCSGRVLTSANSNLQSNYRYYKRFFSLDKGVHMKQDKPRRLAAGVLLSVSRQPEKGIGR